MIIFDAVFEPIVTGPLQRLLLMSLRIRVVAVVAKTIWVIENRCVPLFMIIVSIRMISCIECAAANVNSSVGFIPSTCCSQTLQHYLACHCSCSFDLFTSFVTVSVVFF